MIGIKRNACFFNKWCQNNQTSTYKKMNLETALYLSQKFNLKWIIGSKVKCKTAKLLEDNTENLADFGFGEGLDTTPKG